MGGGLIQLSAFGAQDIYLTGNPQFTFFKTVYRRHTNFAIETIEQIYNGNANPGNKITFDIARVGDLISGIMLEIDYHHKFTLDKIILENNNNDTLDFDNNNTPKFTQENGIITLTSNGNNGNNTTTTIDIDNDGNADNIDLNKEFGNLNNIYKRLGFFMFEYIELEIGGQLIDTHYGDWMDIWCYLTHNYGKSKQLERLINGSINSNYDDNIKKLYVPLQFWFCRNPGLALPLIALQYHEVKINIQIKKLEKIIESTVNNDNIGIKITSTIEEGAKSFTKENTTVTFNGKDNIIIDDFKILIDYVYVDTDERRRFAQTSHEYIFEQLQYSNIMCVNKGTNNIELRFNHPVKELIWILQKKDNINKNFNYFRDDKENDLMKSAKIQLNNIDRFSNREATYFRLVQPYKYHNGYMSQDSENEYGGFYSYSFSLNPEEYQPSGSCNFSRIDNAVLTMDCHDDANEAMLKIYAVNYNVIRIMKGMGGLAYSN